MMIDGTFSNILDFSFTVAGVVFYNLYVLVDGIYPELARFVKTISEPIGRAEKYYAAWQEGARKMIERAFGVLQSKFHCLVKPMEWWYPTDFFALPNYCTRMSTMSIYDS